jgi:Glycosyltransferase family 87
MSRRPLWRDALTLAAVLALAFAWYLMTQGDYFYDARAYWSIDYSDMYGASLVGRPATYLYSPAFAQVFWPLTLLPWGVFAALWSALNLAILAWMAGPIVAAVLLYFPFLPIRDEITTGNIHLLIAAAIVIGFRYSSSYSFPLLTKVTPGVGVLWFAAARRWRAFAVALGTTAAIVLVSFALNPQAWFDWISLLTASSSVPVSGDVGIVPGPLWLRTLAAAGLVLLGGWRSWRWTIPVAAFVALPVTWSSGLAILVALIPIYRRHRVRWDWKQGRVQVIAPDVLPPTTAS